MKTLKAALCLLFFCLLVNRAFSHNDGWERWGYLDYKIENNSAFINDSLLLIISAPVSYNLGNLAEIYNINTKTSFLSHRWKFNDLKNVFFSSLSNQIAFFTNGKKIDIYDYFSGIHLRTLYLPDDYYKGSPCGNYIINFDSQMNKLFKFCLYSRQLRIWSLESGDKLLDITLDTNGNLINAFFNKHVPDILYLIYHDSVQTYNSVTGELLSGCSIQLKNEINYKLSFDNNSLIYLDSNNNIESVNLITGVVNYKLINQNNFDIINFCETNDGRKLIVAYDSSYFNSNLIIYDTHNLAQLKSLALNSINLQIRNGIDPLINVSNDLNDITLKLTREAICYTFHEYTPIYIVERLNLADNLFEEYLPQGNIGDVIQSMQFSPDGKKLLFCGDDNNAVIWEPEQEKLDYSFPYKPGIHCFTFSGDELLFFNNDSIYVFDVVTAKYVDSSYIRINPDTVFNLENNTRLLLRQNDIAYFFDLANGKIDDSIRIDALFSITPKNYSLHIVDGHTLCVVSDRFEIVYIDLNTKLLTNKVTMEEPFDKGQIFDDISPDGTHLLSSYNDTYYIWDIKNLSLSYTKKLGIVYQRQVKFLNNNTHLLVWEFQDPITDSYQTYGLNIENDNICYLGERNPPLISPDGQHYADWICPADYYYFTFCNDLILTAEDKNQNSIPADEIYPGEYFINLQINKAGPAELMIFNYTGKMLISEKLLSLQAGINKIDLNKYGLATGLYLVCLKTQKKIITRKLLILN